jgi:putative PIN family toxin of toxin-antitoxin system
VIAAALDANTIVSGMLVTEGNPRRVVDAAYAGAVRCISSSVIVAEVLTTLGRGRVLRRYDIDPAEVERLREFLESRPVSVEITARVEGVATHPEDDLILATAVSGQADYLVTGDRQLLALGSYQGVTIVTPRDFLAILEAEAPA